MPDKVDEIYFAPCGVNCFVCYVHLKKKKACNGCYESDLNKPERCKHCLIKQCVIDKKIKYCFECTEYPCKRINNLEKSYITRYGVSLLDNAKMVQSAGLTYFFSVEKDKWRCPRCGGVVTQHGKLCSECENKTES
ncbi:DUF3795 domain-containing protein [Teretinema zuelzerae]